MPLGDVAGCGCGWDAGVAIPVPRLSLVVNVLAGLVADVVLETSAAADWPVDSDVD